MIEGLGRLAADVFWAILEGIGQYFLGKMGSWTARLFTLGKVDVDEESWTALFIGWCVFVVAIAAAASWRWYQ